VESFNRDQLTSRKAELQAALQQLADEYQRLTGAIQLIDTLISELDEPETENIK
jgi:hypothetical protein